MGETTYELCPACDGSGRHFGRWCRECHGTAVQDHKPEACVICSGGSKKIDYDAYLPIEDG